MANHPNRSAKRETFMMWQPHIETLTILRGRRSDMPRQVGDRWQEGPVANNKIPPYSLFTNDIMKLGQSLSGYYGAGTIDALRFVPARANHGDRFIYFEGAWKRLLQDGTPEL